MTSEQVVTGDTGVILDAEILFGDLDTATTKEFHAISPSGVLKTWTATVVGTKIRYSTVQGDLDEQGIWRIVPYIEWSPSTYQHYAPIYLDVFSEGS